MHWGKAGWEPEHGVNLCFDGQQEFGDNWCRFGCAVEMLDPRGKFRSDADIWQFKASEGGESVPFASCCDENGFDFAKCQCMPAPRPSCPALSG